MIAIGESGRSCRSIMESDCGAASDLEAESQEQSDLEPESQQEQSDLDLWVAAGGLERLDADLEEIKAFGYGACLSLRRWSSEVVVGVELPFDRLRLGREFAHSLRLEPGLNVVVKIVAQVPACAI